MSRAWKAEFDRLCDLFEKLRIAKGEGQPDTRPTFNALVVDVYKLMRTVPEGLNEDCRATLGRLLDDYLADEDKQEAA